MTQTQKSENTRIAQITEKPAKKVRGVPFKKGEDPRRNTTGQNKGSVSLTAMIRKKIRTLSPDGKREALEILADNIIQDALDSSDNMRKLIWNYLDGLPKANLDITSGGEELRNLTASIKKIAENK